MNKKNKDSVGAEAPVKKKLKLSEIVSAYKEGRLELDCKAVFLVVTDKYCGSAFDYDRCRLISKTDTQLAMIANGVAAMANACMKFDPDACAAMARFTAKSYHEDKFNLVDEALNRLFGKEGRSHE